MGLRRALLVWRLNALAWVAGRLLRSPLFFAWCRRFPRLASVGGMQVVVEHAEAVRVLDATRSFGVIYLERMRRLDTPILLGFDRSPPHDEPRKALLPTLSGAAIAHLYGASMTAAEPIVRGGGGRVELVHQLTDPVLSATVGKHLGTGAVSRTQLDAARLVFWDIFINLKGNPDVSEPADAAAKALRAHVGACVRDRHAELDRGAAMREDVLGRVLDAQRARRSPFLTDAQAVNEITGLLVAWVASISRGMAFAVDALLDHREAIRAGHAAAVAGDRDAVWAILQEAMRLRPPVPGIERRCMREGPLTGGRIARERELVLLTGGAMLDPAAFPRPRHFDPCRASDPEVSERLLGFGYGMHKCLGVWVSEQQMSAIAAALLVRPNLGRGSKLKLAGPLPDRLDVVFDAV